MYQNQHIVTTHKRVIKLLMYAPPAPTTPLRKLYNYTSNLHFSKDNKEVNNNTMVEKTSEFLDFLNRKHLPRSPVRGRFNKDLPIQRPSAKDLTILAFLNGQFNHIASVPR